MAAPVYRLRTPTGTGAEMLQFKSANGSRASRRWEKSGKTKNISKRKKSEGVSRLPLVGDQPLRRARPKTFPRGGSLKAYRASRWSAIGLIGDPAQKTVLDEAGFLMEAFTAVPAGCSSGQSEYFGPEHTAGSAARDREPTWYCWMRILYRTSRILDVFAPRSSGRVLDREELEKVLAQVRIAAAQP